jgi:drug/metabolite transporter (DMT)-like permease
MNKAIPFLLLITTMFLWAANFYAVKIALEFYTPLSVATLRFLFGVLTLILLFYIQFGKKLIHFKFTKREWLHLFLTSFFGIFLTIYFFNMGLKTTSAINGSLIIATSPAITAVFSNIILKRKLSTMQWAAICLSFFGVLLILLKGDLSALMQLSIEIGDIYMLLMAIVFSMSQILIIKYLSHIDSLVLTTITSLISLVIFGLFSAKELVITEIPSDYAFWSSILFMGILGSGIAYTAFYYCVIKLGATTSSLYMNLIPFFAVLLAFPFGEKIYSIQLIGGGIIIIGLLIFGVSKKKQQTA